MDDYTADEYMRMRKYEVYQAVCGAAEKEVAGHAGGTGGRTVYFCAGTSGDA